MLSQSTADTIAIPRSPKKPKKTREVRNDSFSQCGLIINTKRSKNRRETWLPAITQNMANGGGEKKTGNRRRTKEKKEHLRLHKRLHSLESLLKLFAHNPGLGRGEVWLSDFLPRAAVWVILYISDCNQSRPRGCLYSQTASERAIWSEGRGESPLPQPPVAKGE